MAAVASVPARRVDALADNNDISVCDRMMEVNSWGTDPLIGSTMVQSLAGAAIMGNGGTATQ